MEETRDSKDERIAEMVRANRLGISITELRRRKAEVRDAGKRAAEAFNAALLRNIPTPPNTTTWADERDMSDRAVEYARRVGKALTQMPYSIALRAAVRREMEPLREAMLRRAANTVDETENQVGEIT
jgi:hypothetical protein